jgi:hypothetical protein
MCNYFSCIFRPNGVINFTETNSHEDVISRLGLCDSTQFNRSFLRIECAGGNINKFAIDESLDSLPTWYFEHEQEYHDKLVKLLVHVNKIMAKRAPLDADYTAKRDALYADYEAKRAPLDAKLAKIPGFVAK